MSLEENVLDEQQEAYITWLTTAPDDRDPPSKQKYAEMIHVAPTTLRRWEKREAFRREWERRVTAIQGSPEKTQRMLDVLYNEGLGGDKNAAKLWLQATNRLAPPSVTVTSEKRASELSDSELDELLAQLAKRELAKRTDRSAVSLSN